MSAHEDGFASCWSAAHVETGAKRTRKRLVQADMVWVEFRCQWDKDEEYGNESLLDDLGLQRGELGEVT